MSDDAQTGNGKAPNIHDVLIYCRLTALKDYKLTAVRVRYRICMAPGGGSGLSYPMRSVRPLLVIIYGL